MSFDIEPDGDPHGQCASEIHRLEQQVKELDASFALRYAADMRAIKTWQAAHPDQLATWPDHADLCVWLIEALAKARLCKDCNESPCRCQEWTEQDELPRYLSDGNEVQPA